MKQKLKVSKLYHELTKCRVQFVNCPTTETIKLKQFYRQLNRAQNNYTNYLNKLEQA